MSRGARTLRAGLAAGVCLVLAAPAPAPAEQPDAAVAADPRVVEADALLGEASGYARAVELYRAVLEDDPAAAEVRVRLARVLSWMERYDESLAAWQRALESSAAPREWHLERAEVLSWAGRYDEAEAAFRRVLADDPDDARAARGLARVYNWSGRKAAADRAYGRALELEDDPDLRREWAVLRDVHGPRTETGFEYFSDSDDFRRLVSSARGSFYLDLDTRVTVRGAFLRVTQEGAGTLATAGLADDDRAYEFSVTALRRFDEGVEAEIELGGRVWEEAGANLLAGARLQVPATGSTVLTARVGHRDLLDSTDSLLAVEDGLRETSTSLSVWSDLGRGLETFAEVGTGFLSDSNLRTRAGASLDWRPWQEVDLRFGLWSGYLRYEDASDVYYDPQLDLTGQLSVALRVPLPRKLEVQLSGGGGYGYARQGGLTSHGPAYRVGGGLGWVRGPFRFGLHASHSRSRRATAYTSTWAAARVGIDF